MSGPALSDWTPDTRPGWVEKWLYLAAEDPGASSNGADPSEIARRLGAVERR